MAAQCVAYQFGDGSTFNGEHTLDEGFIRRHGTGTQVMKQCGQTYSGEFVRDQIHGQGELVATWKEHLSCYSRQN
eukprot:m.93231 g.93231  ORF g.93231 m.93231 type:complete len:75 (-) comp13392_c0_seq1:563-787(-)